MEAPLGLPSSFFPGFFRGKKRGVLWGSSRVKKNIATGRDLKNKEVNRRDPRRCLPLSTSDI